MILLNIIGFIFMVVVIVIGICLKCYTKKQLKEIEGTGKVYNKDEDKENQLWI